MPVLRKPRGLSWVPVAFEDTLRGAPFTLSNGTAFKVTFLSCFGIMVNAIKGLLISCDIPMAQFIINLDNSLPPSQKFIIHNLDSTHLFVQPHGDSGNEGRINLCGFSCYEYNSSKMSGARPDHMVELPLVADQSNVNSYNKQINDDLNWPKTFTSQEALEYRLIDRIARRKSKGEDGSSNGALNGV
ncbi:hypothetical protein RHMOL_Rhmol07G0119200 [Rhododendron molle]|uniref:Uncharacterized protein n=1 Tax=Rhododendron molle TaxID=49168 RepID=A0ACC0N0T2_RHOML|nr:hypothetical protein RHMOL_Rhmol07G0119200 [Rhododendron molle]